LTRYFDSAYIAKCYLPEDGHAEISDLAAQSERIASAAIARLEVAAVFHRKLRERAISAAIHRELHHQFTRDVGDGVWRLLPMTEVLLVNAQTAFAKLPSSLFIRSADCLHLVAAREAGFTEIYSNDRHLLAAASHFGLKGVDISIAP
jgi:predicted nucleic acid-binding protein